MENPGLGGIGRIGAGPAQTTIGGDVYQLGNAIAIEVNKSWRLAVDMINNLVLRPESVGALRILKPGCILAGEVDDQNVRPAVMVEVIYEGKKIVGRIERVEGDRRIDRSLLLKSRPCIPVGSCDDVQDTITVEVANRCAFRKEIAAELGASEERLKLAASGVGLASRHNQGQFQDEKEGAPA